MNPELWYDGRHFELMRTYRAELPDGRYILVPEGVRTNFGSIPWFVRWLISPIDRHMVVPAIVHDFLTYEFTSGQVTYVPVIYKPNGRIDDSDVSWDQAATIMRQMMKSLGAPGWKRGLVYAGLRVYGWWSDR